MTTWLADIAALQSLVDAALAAFAAGDFAATVACAERALAAVDAASPRVDRTDARLWLLLVRARATIHLGDAARTQVAIDALVEDVAEAGDPGFALWLRLVELEAAMFTGLPANVVQAHADALWSEVCGVTVDRDTSAELAGGVLEACSRLLDVSMVQLAAVADRAARVAPGCPSAARVAFDRALFERYMSTPAPERAAACVARIRAEAPRADDPPRLEHLCDVLSARLELRVGRRDRALAHMLTAWRRLPGFGHARAAEVDTGLMLLDVGLEALDDATWASVAAALRRLVDAGAGAELELLARLRGAGRGPWWDAASPPVGSLAELLRWTRRADAPALWVYEQAESLARAGAGVGDPHQASVLDLLRGASLGAIAPDDPEVEPLLDRAMERAQLAEVWLAAARERLSRRRGDGAAVLTMQALRGLHEVRGLRGESRERRAVLRQYREIVNFALAEHLERLRRGVEGAQLGLLDTLELARCHFCDELLTGGDELGPRHRPEPVEAYQRALPADVWILCALRIDDLAVLAAVAPAGVIVQATPLSDERWSERSRRLLRALRSTSAWTPGLTRRAAEVSESLGLDALLSAARGRWGAPRHICVVRDERLDEVPFAALVVDGAPLGETVGLSFHPCMRDAVAALAPVRQAIGPIVALLPEVEADGAAARPDAPGPEGGARELAVLRERGAQVHAGGACTPEAARAAARAARVLHIGGHNDGPRRDERIRLGPGAPPLTASLARELALEDVALVVLNACDSAQDHLGDLADAWEGLTASFRIAGARSVVSSRMRASADHCALFAHHFYAGLARGYAIDALRAAQRAMAECGPRLPGLFVGHWATYELHGAPFLRLGAP